MVMVDGCVLVLVSRRSLISCREDFVFEIRGLRLEGRQQEKNYDLISAG